MIEARRDGKLTRQIGPIFIFRLMQYWGTYRGYHFSGNINAQLH